MEIILVQDVENLGYIDDIVKVKPGYARNFLIPQKMAVAASGPALKDLEERKRQRARKAELMLSKIQDVIADLQKAVIKIGAKVGTTDKIFGSVTTHHIAEAIKEQTNHDIDRRKITIVEGDVKTVGTYTAKIDLHEDHSVDLSFEVIPE